MRRAGNPWKLDKPVVSLIVCTLGRSEPLSRLFKSLREQTSADFEIIVVDQNKPGDLQHILEKTSDGLELTHIYSEPGLSRARNVGLRQCRGEVIGFPDDDCWYPPDTIAAVAKAFDADPALGILAGRTLDASGRESLGKFLKHSAAITKANVWDCGNSNAIFIRSKLARRVGNFDEALGVGAQSPFGSGEETDYILRALKHPYRAVFCYKLIVHHDQVLAPDDSRMLSRAAAYSRGYGRVLRLHRYSAAYVAMRIMRSVVRGAIAIAMIDMSMARYKFAWARGTIAGYFHSSEARSE